MIAEHLGNAIGGKKSLRIHPSNREHPFSGSQALAQGFDTRVGREEFVVPDNLDISGINAEEIERRQSEQNHDDMGSSKATAAPQQQRPERKPTEQGDREGASYDSLLIGGEGG